ncbi:MAG: triose-phosphate isomerase [Alphaproteobacteria bacterium]|nr:triose-phosphate isomerase [Alphaproteobacteria bacterium]
MSVAKLIVGNWKMNGLLDDSRTRAQELADAARNHKSADFEMVLCPPAPLIAMVGDIVKDTDIKWGAQDCHEQVSGAHTGDISAQMLKDLGCSYVILGHSERRQNHGETSAQVNAKAQAAQAAGLIAIICIGETDAQRSAGKADEVVTEQLRASVPETATPENTVIAYEPIWAIGTGKTASADDIRHMHALIRAKASEKVKNGAWLKLLYGGSVKQGNAGEILHIANVDGVLVGGASLKSGEFWGIAQASAEGKALSA